MERYVDYIIESISSESRPSILSILQAMGYTPLDDVDTQYMSREGRYYILVFQKEKVFSLWGDNAFHLVSIGRERYSIKQEILDNLDEFLVSLHLGLNPPLEYFLCKK